MASTIKVDNVQNQPGTNIINKCSTTVTLGASGDNIALASGATQTGFGRTGTVDWVTTPKVTGDSPVTAATGSGYFLNTTAGQITINLPAGAAGSIVSMADYAATWQTNKVTVAANGSEKIGGEAEDAVLETEGQSVTFVYVDSTQGWINTMDSTSNVRGVPPFIIATGGTPCTGAIVCTNYKVHTFTGPGTFCVSCAGGPSGSDTVDYMVIAGAGGGGGFQGAAGGGAGGYRESSGVASGCYTASPLGGGVSALPVSVQGYPITVGGGGAGGVSGSPCALQRGQNGNDSIFSSITSTAGGGGGAHSNPNPGQTGGSGGGSGGRFNVPGAAGNTPPTSPPQGTAGGNSAPSPTPGSNDAGGGGGGATVAAANAADCAGSDGGAGATSSITATPTARAGGGGGGNEAPNQSAGGAGNPSGTGGYAGDVAAGAGCVNKGGGGGGSGTGSPGTGGLGGSGVVIIRYKFQ